MVAWESARNAASGIKQQAQNLKDRSLAGNVGSSAILGFITYLADQKLRLLQLAAVPGLAAYAQQQVNDPTLDVAAAFNAMVAQLDALRDWVITNFPKDVGNFLLAQQFQADGRTVDRQFSTAALSGFRAQLDALLATID